MGYSYPTSSRKVSDTFSIHVQRGSVNPGTDYVIGAGGDVYAIAAGKVMVADGNPDGSGGRTICIYHDDGSSSDYLHLNAVSVTVGQRVSQGQRIGFSGGSGYGSNTYYGAHLHISFRPHNQIDWFGNVGNVDFDALIRNSNTSGGNATPIEEDDMFTDQDRANLKAVTEAVFIGGTSMSDGRKGLQQSIAEIHATLSAISVKLGPVSDAIFRGGTSMSDGGKAIQQSLAEIQKKLDALKKSAGIS